MRIRWRAMHLLSISMVLTVGCRRADVAAQPSSDLVTAAADVPRESWRLVEPEVFGDTIKGFSGRFAGLADGSVVLRHDLTGVLIHQNADGSVQSALGSPLADAPASDVFGPFYRQDGSAVMVDVSGGRIVTIEPEGKKVSPWKISVRENLQHPATIVAMDANGRVFLSFKPGYRDSLGRGDIAMATPSANTTMFETIRLPDLPTARVLIGVELGMGIVLNQPVPFYPTPSVAIGSAGEIYWADGDSYRVHVRRKDQADVVFLSREVQSVPVSADERAERTETITARHRVTDPTWHWSGRVVPDRHAPIEDLITDPVGGLWVVVPLPSDSIPRNEQFLRVTEIKGWPLTRWVPRQAFEVFDKNGNFLAKVAIPPMVRVSRTQVTGDYIWFCHEDLRQLKATVVRYRIVRD